MIQRLQTLWLLLAAACAFATFKFPYYSGTNAKNIADQELTASGNFLILLITIVVGGLALFTISLYKKRRMQMLLCILGILLEAVLIFLYYSESKTYIRGTLAFTAILHGCIVFLFFIAAKAINKDEKLVKDSDRLR
jgi:hypothetical protein